MTRILVADSIAKEGLSLLKQHAQVDVRTGLNSQEIKAIIHDYDALVVRSETKVTAEIIRAASNLQVVGRAGVGVDNIDLDAATERGVVVVNAPTGNIIAAAEHTWALMLSIARKVPQAHQSLKAGQWNRKEFMGAALKDKTLGIVGLGRVGSQVARRAQGFDMRLLGYDPFVSTEYARTMGVKPVTLNELLSESDFITLHTPMTQGSQPLLGPQELALVKSSAYIINVARGGLIDDVALFNALENGQIAGAALDVFSEEPPVDDPLVNHSKVVVTPHLGASTTEAQQEVAIEAAEQVIAVLAGQPARYTVNVPFVPPEAHAVVSPYLKAAALLGRLVGQVSDGQVLSLEIDYQGDISSYDVTLLKSAVLTGLLGPVSEERVNLVNALIIAQQRGLKVVERKGGMPEHYGNLITVILSSSVGTTTVAGTMMRSEPHIVRINDYWLKIVPTTPYLMLIENQDRPGMVGAVGTIIGKHAVNISFMEVGRLTPQGQAMMVLGVDEDISEAVMEEIRSLDNILGARIVRV
jgi:D-3-phosphoglycerate dehydrogenase